MGLSNQERRIGIYHTVNKIVQIKDQWVNDKKVLSCYLIEHKNILNLVDNLWHATIGNMSNSLHWIMGSSAYNKITTDDPYTVWEIAITDNLNDIIREKDKLVLKEIPNDLDHLKISDLLSACGSHSEKYIFEIYSWCEQLIYYLRRYDDVFLKKYENLNELTSNIMGYCFNSFINEDCYKKAYIVRQIAEIIYTDLYPYSKYDFVAKFASENHLHYGFLKSMDMDIKDLIKYHITLCTIKKGLYQKRLEILFDMAIFNCIENKSKYDKVKKLIDLIVDSKLIKVKDNLIKKYEKIVVNTKKDNVSNKLNAYGLSAWEAENFIKENDHNN